MAGAKGFGSPNDRGGVTGQHAVQQAWAFGEAPGDEAAADPGVAGERPLPVDPVAIAVAAAEQSEAAGMGHRRGEPAAGDRVHGGEQNRVLDAECLCQPVPDGHSCWGLC